MGLQKKALGDTLLDSSYLYTKVGLLGAPVEFTNIPDTLQAFYGTY